MFLTWLSLYLVACALLTFAELCVWTTRPLQGM